MNGKKVLLGITGGIAAYKSAELCRLLIKSGADVRVVMSAGAKAFMQPLTFQALTGHEVRDSLLDERAESGMGHIELARWADIIVVAPATANFIAHLAHGFAEDLLTTLCLATPAPIAVAPAMNQQMWSKKITQKNVQALADISDCQPVLVWGPDEGSQACGDVGPGRMLEPADIFARIKALFSADAMDASGKSEALPLAGKRVLITAGPTRESLDPVRYISNHSSGKMGFAIAAEAVSMGAAVTLVSGPVSLPTPSGVTRVDVSSAQQMYEAVLANVPGMDVFVASAAVADYRPEQIASQKIKKSNEGMVIHLIRNPDIVATVAGLTKRPFTVGFAAETNDVLSYAKGKLQKKGLDLIIANDVSRSDIGFNSDHNDVTAIWSDGEQSLGMANKSVVAQRILRIITEHLSKLSSPVAAGENLNNKGYSESDDE
ncbi:MAG: bifunctional phosphopantothenoylcysteine decarboxylase/phosphopantothenate--cysteine ligase CoaBC [Hahellaceae bacterium]|nr:bifunctional phosphopantothenoylcysteine decarboxylase/phosphopantothenate--cysteine ligase CoaBC [Hahellaceae bacterium]